MSFWNGKKIFITGHSGFKGSWLSLWLKKMGSHVTGYSLDPPSEPNMFSLAGVEKNIVSITGDIRDYNYLIKNLETAKPDIVFHLAAQSLVRKSYKEPIETLSTNIMGTANILEAVKHIPSVKVMVNITSDKCYDNREWYWGYREIDRLGGHDPYSCSKSCSELITTAYNKSFFFEQGPVLASARAGNVIGGGDWGEDRLVPDVIRAIQNNEQVVIRYPNAIRPWQHVLDPLRGYIMLAEKCFLEGKKYSKAWNFGPDYDSEIPVSFLTETLIRKWGHDKGWVMQQEELLHETSYLRLDNSMSRHMLGWKPLLCFDEVIQFTVDWYKAYDHGEDLYELTMQQIESYLKHY